MLFYHYIRSGTQNYKAMCKASGIGISIGKLAISSFRFINLISNFHIIVKAIAFFRHRLFFYQSHVLA